MKSRIFMYLFIFSMLLIIFQYVNSKNIIDKYEKDFKSFETKAVKYQDSILQLQDQNFELSYFNIEGNEDAYNYFESDGYNVDELLPVIKDALYKTNDYEGDDHPIVPFVSMTDSKLIINKIRVLNHKWIIANFTDGEHWGEVFLNYTLNEKNELKFKLTDYLMYPIGAN